MNSAAVKKILVTGLIAVGAVVAVKLAARANIPVVSGVLQKLPL